MADARTSWCAYVHARVGDEDEPNASRRKKRDALLHTYVRIDKRVEIPVCVCVCVCLLVHERLVRVCVDGECVQRSVSSCRAWSGRERRAVSAPHPESPLETNPSYRDEPPPRGRALLSLVYVPLSPYRFALFLSPLFRRTPSPVCNPCVCVAGRRNHVEENPMKRGKNARVVRESTF